MKSALLLVGLSAVLIPGAFGAEPEPALKFAPMPFYPPLCRTARIQGKVTVHFTVNEQGDTSDIEADGSSLLRDAAIKEIKDWKYSWNPPCLCRAKRTAVVQYILDDGSDDRGADTVVRWFGTSSVTRVEIETGPIVINTNVSHTK